MCDAAYDQNGLVGASDLAIFKLNFGPAPANTAVDCCDGLGPRPCGVANMLDVIFCLRPQFAGPPGP